MGEWLESKPGMGNEGIFEGDMTRPMFTRTEEQQQHMDDNADKMLEAALEYSAKKDLTMVEFVDLTQYLGIDERLDKMAERHGMQAQVAIARKSLDAQRIS